MGKRVEVTNILSLQRRRRWFWSSALNSSGYGAHAKWEMKSRNIHYKWSRLFLRVPLTKQIVTVQIDRSSSVVVCTQLCRYYLQNRWAFLVGWQVYITEQNWFSFLSPPPFHTPVTMRLKKLLKRQLQNFLEPNHRSLGLVVLLGFPCNKITSLLYYIFD